MKLTLKVLATRIDSTEAKLDAILNILQPQSEPSAQPQQEMVLPSVTPVATSGFVRDNRCAANKSIDFSKLANAQLNKAIAKAKLNGCTYSVWYTVKKDGSRDYVLPYRQYSAKTLKKVDIKGGVLLADVAPTGIITTHVKGVFAKAA